MPIKPLLKNITRNAARHFLRLLYILLVGIHILFFLLQYPFVQRLLTERAADFLNSRFNLSVQIGEINFALPSYLVIKDVCLLDLQADTLWASKEIRADLFFEELLKKSIVIDNLLLDGVTAKIYQQADGAFNYAFLEEAFSDTTTASTQKPSEKPWSFALKRFSFRQVDFLYQDTDLRTDIRAKVGGLRAEFREMDIEKNSFHLNYLDIKNTDFSFRQGIPLKPPPHTDQKNTDILPDISIKTLGIAETHFLYSDSVSGQKIRANLGKITLDAQKIDLPSQNIALNKLLLNNSQIAYQIWHTPKTTPPSEAKKSDRKQKKKPWHFRLHELEMAQNDFAYNDAQATPQKTGIDYNHLRLENQSAYAENLYFTDSLWRADVRQCAFEEQSGFVLKQLRTSLRANEQKLTLRNFLLKTQASEINEYIALEYPSLSHIFDDLSALSLNVGMNGAKIGLSDLLYFVPEWQTFFSKRTAKRTKAVIDLRLRGSLQKYEINKCKISWLQNSFLSLQGKTYNLLKNPKAALNIDTLNFNAADLHLLLASQPWLNDYTLPENTGIRGKVKGTTEVFEADLALNSTLGKLHLDIAQNPDSLSSEKFFEADLVFDEVQIGKVLKMPETLGSAGGKIYLNGIGLTEGKPKGMVEAEIGKAGVLGYTYRNTKLAGNYSPTGYRGDVWFKDPNVKLHCRGKVSYKNALLESEAKVNVKKLNFNAPGFLDLYDSLCLAANMQLRFQIDSANYLNGTLDAENLSLREGKKMFNMRQLRAKVAESKHHFQSTLFSDWLDFRAEGNAPFLKLLKEIPAMFYHYYAYTKTPPPADNHSPGRLEFSGKLKQTDVITGLLYPDLQQLSPGDFSVLADRKSQKITGVLSCDKIRYADIDFNKAEVMLEGTPQKLGYHLGFSEVVTKMFRIQNPSVSGYAASDSLHTLLGLNDSTGTQQFLVGGVLSGKDSSFAFRIKPHQLKFNYKPWQIPENNLFSYNKGLLRAKNFNFSENKSGQLFKIQLDGPDSTQTNLNLLFRDFDLRFLTKAIQYKENLLGGTINGRLAANNLTDTLHVNALLDVRNLELMGDTLGNLRFSANNRKKFADYNISAQLLGRGNDVEVKGTYKVVSEKNPVNFAVNIKNFNVGTLNNLTQGQVSELSGSLQGRVVFRGNTDQPIVRGSLYTPKLFFRPNYLNAAFSLEDERIRFGPRGIVLKAFTLRDEQQNPGTIDGQILTTNYQKFTFDLTVTTDNFMLINTNANDNALFYGKVFTSSKLKIGGTPRLPIVNMKSTILEGTDLTYILPDENLETVNEEGVVEFVDIDERDSTLVVVEKEQKESGLKGFALEGNFEVSRQAKLTIIIDPEAGDKLSVQGGGNLSLAMDPAGTMSLAGIYAIEKGNYLLTFYNLVKRKFSIKPGSQLIWTGNPYDAELDITALYHTKATPYGLFPPTNDADQIRVRQQQLPFTAELKMKGQLEKPEVNFAISLPPLHKGALNGSVDAQLQQLNQDETEVNKQVFALLILNTFVSSNAISSGQNNLVTTTARTSVSRLLTEQLNRISGRYLKGFDLNFELNSYDNYATKSVGGRTELGVKFSKKLFNSRVKINVGGNVNLINDQENISSEQEKKTQHVRGNASVEYLLTPDGRYRMKAYHRDAFGGVIDGNFIETGLSFIFTKNYDRFSELFGKKKTGEKEEKNRKKREQTQKKPPAKNAKPPEIEDDEGSS